LLTGVCGAQHRASRAGLFLPWEPSINNQTGSFQTLVADTKAEGGVEKGVGNFLLRVTRKAALRKATALKLRTKR
jgi:hypothetical protein